MNAKIFCKRTSVFLFAIVLLAMASPTDAQCVMCKAVAEDSAADGGLGAGLNKGILYLMAVPYILLSALFFVIYKKWKEDSTS
ncbi:hypothetical protein OAT89_01470 [bacterium]|jgi:hypothetical protein|nr:hypothetical protein [Flavobacteriales bacterium]MDC3198311.1 hypothetical protein [bacterium]